MEAADRLTAEFKKKSVRWGSQKAFGHRGDRDVKKLPSFRAVLLGAGAS